MLFQGIRRATPIACGTRRGDRYPRGNFEISPAASAGRSPRILMPELRKDYVTDTWVVFSTVRGKRPQEAPAGGRKTDPAKCPFCLGHEHMTPPEVLAYRKGGTPNGPGWWVRCIPNKYPAPEVEGQPHRRLPQLFHWRHG